MVRKISKEKTTCGDTMWKSFNWVVISSEKELEVTTRRFDQYALIVLLPSAENNRTIVSSWWILLHWAACHTFLLLHSAGCLGKACSGVGVLMSGQVDPLTACGWRGINDCIIHCLCLTCRPWDMNMYLNVQCKLSQVRYPAYARQWINLCKTFSNFYKTKRMCLRWVMP